MNFTTKDKFFTLIELIAVIVIMGILAAIVLPNISDSKKDAIISMMESNIRTTQTAVDVYQLENNGLFPTTLQPTFNNPQRVEFDLLYPKYLKNLPNENKLPEQKYWVDVYGKVWGSTIDSPNPVYDNGDIVEWVSNEKTISYNFYEVKSENQKTSKAYNVSIGRPFEIFNKEISRVQVPKSSNGYLISAVDQYGLEAAPVGPEYRGIAEDWFQPIIRKDGKFTIEFGGKDIMYWDRFWTLEDKPEGTNISYRFSVQDKDGNWLEYKEDFYQLEPSNRIRIEVNMIGNGNQKPSLLDMRVDFHFKGEQVDYFKPIFVQKEETPLVNISEDYVVYRYDVPQDLFVRNIIPPYHNGTSSVNAGGGSNTGGLDTSYTSGGSRISTYDSNGTPIRSIGSIGSGTNNSTIFIVTETSTSYNPPLVEVSKNPIPVQQENLYSKDIPELDYLINIPEVKDPKWTTVDGFNVFFFAGNFEEVNWSKSIIEDIQPEHTRILYYYTPSTNEGWGNPYTNISEVPNSRAVKVAVVMQVETEYLRKVNSPEFISMTLEHEGGSLASAPKGEEFLMVNPKKLNDFDKNGYFTTTQIEWNYLFEDSNGSAVKEVEWRGDKQSLYSQEGTYSVGLRVKNNKDEWSQWVDINITVKTPINPIQKVVPTGWIAINTPEELAKIGRDKLYPSNGKYILMNNLDLNVAPYNANQGWNPISYFQGQFDGNGLTIKNLYINRPTSYNQGLFNVTQYARISNLRIDGVHIVASSKAGALIGHASRQTYVHRVGVSNVYVEGSTHLGGLIGTADWSATSEIVSIKESYVRDAVINGRGDWNGGFIGSTNTIGNAMVIENNYVFANVTGGKYIGGFIGDADGSDKFKYNYSVSTVPKKTNDNPYRGAIYGWSYAYDTYFNKDIATYGYYVNSGFGKTTQELKLKSTFKNWDFNNVWYIDEGVDYPRLSWEKTVNQ